jgi:transcriptional regulator with XRE-family HTH domain
MPGKGLLPRQVEAWDVEVGRRIRARRLECWLSQQELAHGLGVSFQQIQKYEKGANRISAGRLLAICNLLQVPITFFYDSAAPARSGETRLKPSRLFDLLDNGDTLQLAVAFDRLADRNVRRAMVQLMEKLAGPEIVSRKSVKSAEGGVKVRKAVKDAG